MFELRIRQLERVHQNLDHQIDALEAAGKADDAQLSEMKKQRLAVKDQLRELRRRQWDHDQEVRFDNE
jgi:hypothetical protein